jgi:hypothetical protein
LEAGIPARLTSQEGRKFGFTVGLAFAAFAGIAYWRGHTVSWKVFGAVGGALLLAGGVIPTLLGPVQRGWMGFAHLLSKVTTPIVMGIVYFLVVTPIALLMRGIGRQPMKHAEQDGGFWIPAPSGGRSDMERQF